MDDEVVTVKLEVTKSASIDSKSCEQSTSKFTTAGSTNDIAPTPVPHTSLYFSSSRRYKSSEGSSSSTAARKSSTFVPRNTPQPRKDYKPATHEKYRWCDPDHQGIQLTAAGLLLYDEVGIWVVGEVEKGSIIYTDPGGKYNFEDGDIYATVAREVGEETYHSLEISRKRLYELAATYPPTYVRGHHNFPVYACYVLPTNLFNVTPDIEEFNRRRQIVLQSNPRVPNGCYKAVELRRIPYYEINTTPLSFRLSRVLRDTLIPPLSQTKVEASPLVTPSTEAQKSLSLP